MARIDQIWAERQRLRYTRPDADRWVKPDSRRAAGLQQYDYDKPRPRDAENDTPPSADRAAWLAAYGDGLRPHSEVKALRAALALRRLRRALKAGFNPAQPRDDHGRWTDAGGGGTGAADGDGESSFQLVADDQPSRYRVDLIEERQLGGHAIEGHVGRSPESLLARVRQQAMDAVERGDLFGGLSVGSFPLLEAANKLVNSILAQNPDKIDLVVNGGSSRQDLDGRFSSVTGYEAYLRNERSRPYMRDTYGVRVVIVPDRRAGKGFRVDTAFPTHASR